MKQTNFLSLISKAGVFALAMSVLLFSSCTENVEPEDTTSPEADFTFTADELVVSYVNTSKGASAADPYSWTFEGGDPASSTAEGTAEAPIVVTYPEAGTYKVTLTASRANGKTDTKERLVTVSKLPVAAFSFASIGRETTFTNESANAETYSWDFGDGSPISTDENPVHEFGSNGSYTVKLVSTSGAISDEIEHEVTVVGPEASYEYSVTDKTVTFTNTSTDATSYSWDFGDQSAASTDENPTHDYADFGIYTVVLTATADDGATSEASMEVTVAAPPEAAFTYAGNALAVTFTNASTGSSAYSWDFGDGNTSTEESPSHTYAAEGEYMVILVAENDFGVTDETREWFIVDAAGATYPTWQNGSIDDYGDGEFKQTNNDMWEKPDHWTGKDGFRAGGISSDGKKLADGTKTLGLKMKNDNNRGGYQEVAVEVGQSYTVTFDVAGDEVLGTDNVRLDVYLVNQRIFAEDDPNLATNYHYFGVKDSELTGKGNFVTMSATFTADSDVLTFFMIETIHTFDGDTEVWVDNITLTKN